MCERAQLFYSAWSETRHYAYHAELRMIRIVNRSILLAPSLALRASHSASPAKKLTKNGYLTIGSTFPSHRIHVVKCSRISGQITPESVGECTRNMHNLCKTPFPVLVRHDPHHRSAKRSYQQGIC